MSKKLTTQEFIEAAVKTHGDAYDYSDSEYVAAKTPVKIFCKVHKEFFYQIAFEHKNGQGCPKCGLLKRNKSQTKTHEDFVKDCTKVHGSTYDYSETVYKNSSNKVTVKCNKHGTYFTQSPKKHLAGQGCPICRYEKMGNTRASNQDRFLESARAVHGDKYIYDKTKYVRSNRKVTITCRVHGDYETSPNLHLTGRCCPHCAESGYNAAKAGHLYILSCGDITKIGITNISPDTRADRISKSFGADFSVKHSWEFEDGSIPDDIETRLLRELRSEYDRPVNRFEGSSECFLNVDHNFLLSRINQEIALRQ